MATSSFLGLETALRGLLAQQVALDVTGHNIANANTAGYTRQSAVLRPTPAFSEPAVTRPGGAGQLGTGVDVAAYERVRDGFLDIQLRAQSMRQGQAEAQKDGLGQVELAFNEPSDTGLQSLLQSYWSSWSDVSNAPENMGTRQALAQASSSLAEGFRNLSSQLDTIAQQTSLNVSSTLDEVNSAAAQIAALNDAIQKSEVSGDRPNDLLDQRDLLVDKLATLGNVAVTQGQYGSIDVTIGGAALVSGASAATIGESDMVSLTSGKLAGLVQLRDTTIPGYRTSLDTIASTLIAQTNAAHAAGFDLTGAGGGQFFTGTSAADIAVNPALITNPALIAASANGQPGNNGNALAIANLQATPLIGQSTIDAAYTQLVTRLGSDSQQAQRTADNAAALTDALESKRQSVSGVSLDEEMTNLVKFQRGYQASARALSAMDDMLEQLITRTGRVGL